MNNESDLWNCESYLGSMMNTSNNTDPIFPQWGQYDPAWSPLAKLQCTSNSLDSRRSLSQVCPAGQRFQRLLERLQMLPVLPQLLSQSRKLRGQPPTNLRQSQLERQQIWWLK